MAATVLTYIQVFVGLGLLGVGGDTLVRGAVGLSNQLGVSRLLIGLVVVGFGTSLPELVTSLSAAFAGVEGIVLGNVIGSNIANILLILGITALIAVIPADRESFKRDAPMLAGATLACCSIGLSGSFNRLTGFVFFAALISYILYTYQKERTVFDSSAQLHEDEATLVLLKPSSVWASSGITIAGMGMIMLGAHWMVQGSVEIAAAFGIPELLIGLTLVAVGTSLPELATSMAAALRGQTDLAFGNIIGSNIFNILGILGVTAMVKPLYFSVDAVWIDLVILVAATGLMLIFAFSRLRIVRTEGVVFLILYLAYLGFIYMRSVS